MKYLLDARPVKNQAIRRSFIKVPDTMDVKQSKALARLIKLLKYAIGEESNA